MNLRVTLNCFMAFPRRELKITPILDKFKISTEWVTGPEQGKSSGRIATFSLRTGMFRDTWTNKVSDARRITAAEMKYM